MMKKQRTKAGAWGLPWESKIFGVKRSKGKPPKSDPEKLGEWKRKQTLEALKRLKKERQEEQRRQIKAIGNVVLDLSSQLHGIHKQIEELGKKIKTNAVEVLE